MRIIKQLSHDIAGNIEEAREKIRTAYELKAEYPEAAAWYKEMAAAHINFNTNGHAAVKKCTEAHKESEAYRANPAFADGMLGAWTALHNDLIAKTAEVKAMIDGYR